MEKNVFSVEQAFVGRNENTSSSENAFRVDHYKVGLTLAHTCQVLGHILATHPRYKSLVPVTCPPTVSSLKILFTLTGILSSSAIKCALFLAAPAAP